MLPSTIDLVRAALRADQTLSPGERQQLLMRLRAENRQPPPKSEPRLVRRADAARRFSISPRSIDRWAKEGLIKKVTLPGRSRASGFNVADIEALIAPQEEKAIA